MELTEPIESLNRQLKDLYGLDTITGLPMWRIVWSDDQLEKQLTDFVNGIQLLYPEVREVRKYPWIRARFVLERLVLVPDISQNDIPTSKLSYEPMWTFEDADRNYLPPRIDAAQFVVDTVYAAMGKGSIGAKYKDEEETLETKQARVNKLQEELFGNETPVGDALAHRYGVGYTGPSKMEN